MANIGSESCARATHPRTVSSSASESASAWPWRSWSVSLEDESGLLGEDAAIAGDERSVAVIDLGVARASHDLPGGVADVMHTARGSGLTVTELTARSVHREVAAEGQ